MPVRIKDEAPNFTAETTQGRITLHDWIGDGWAIMFSHPAGLQARLHWRGLTALAIVAVGAGLAFNWNWLVALGVAPVLLSLLPCLAMCALGLCMSRIGERSCSTSTSAPTLGDSGGDNKERPTLQQERRLSDA